MTREEIISYVQDHPAGKVKIAFTDIDGILRGKYISKDKFLSSLENGLGFCNVIFGWDAADIVYDNVAYTGWHSGYPDAAAVLDLASFRKIPWENDLPFLLGEFCDRPGSPSPVCPRQLLKRIITQSEEQGFYPVFAQEFEWYNFAETPQTAQEKNYRHLTPLSPGMFGYSILRTSLHNPFFADLFEKMRLFSVPLEGLHTETGPGTYEAAICHTAALEAADRATLFKTAVKEIAYSHGIMASFMAKISEHLPGCGGHIHQSLWDRQEGINLFYDEAKKGNMSSLMKSYIAGQLHCLPHILPMLAPTVNSYKRLVEGAWAPTTLTWGIDNRTVALRALPTGKKSARLETRVPGADVNPFLAIAATLASGLYGIKHQLKLVQKPTEGNGYRDLKNGTLPYTLLDATHQMQHSMVARELFGPVFIEHFCQSRIWEWKQHLKAVTDWEYRRYFEII